MAMKINDEPNVSFFADLLYKVFDGTDFWTVEVFLGYVPLSIEIFAC